MANTLSFALLGLIARRPQSGYDLAASMKAPVANFWTSRLSQIYPELAKLEEASLVDVEVVPQEGRPSKKVYRLTEDGRRALSSWVAERPEPSPPRDELLLKTYALPFATDATDRESAAAMYASEAAAAEKNAAHYEEVSRRLASEWNGNPPPLANPAFGQYANLTYGAAASRERAKWCRWLEKQLRADGAEVEGQSNRTKPKSKRTSAAAKSISKSKSKK